MKTKFSILVCLLVIQFAAKAQMKIGDSATTINSASLLELQSTNKGLVFPRISLTSISTSTPLPSGLLTGTVVYNTNAAVTGGNGAGLYVWNGSSWLSLASNSGINSLAWSLVGNSGLSSSTNFIGTTDAIDFVTRTNNTERMRILGANNGSSKAGWIGMGVTIPRSSLDVAGDYTNKNVITIQNTSSTGFSSIDMLDNTGTLKGTFGYANVGTGGNFGGRTYFNSYGSDLLFTANSGSAHIFLKGSTGFIGINTFNPTNALTVLATSNPLFLSGVQATSTFTTDSVLTINSGIVKKAAYSSLANNFWSLTGNAGTNYATNFLGTTDNASMRFRTNNVQRMIIDSVGNVGIGIVSPIAPLHISTSGSPGIFSDRVAANNFGSAMVLRKARDLTSSAGALQASDILGLYTAAGSYGNGLYGSSFNSGMAIIATENWTATAQGTELLLRNTANGASTFTYNMGIKQNGFINLSYDAGATIPYAKLHVNSTSGPSAMTALSGTGMALTGDHFYFENPASTNGQRVFSFSNSGGVFAINANTNNAGATAPSTSLPGAIALKASNGFVGINNNNPSNQLHVIATADPLRLGGLQAGTSADSILTINNGGVVKYRLVSDIGNDNFWSLTGNSGTDATNFLGTTDNTSLRFRTNNTEQMIIDSNGRLGIGSSSFNGLNPAKLLVDYGNTTSNTIVNLKGSIDDYFQMNLQNKSATPSASSDYVATADDGTDSTNYIDMGINSSTYATSADNWGGPHDGYLYTNSKNLVIGTQALNSDVIFLLGGGRQRNQIMRLNASDGHVIIGKGDGTANPLGTTLRGPNASASVANTAGGSLTISGGSATGTATGGALNLTGGITSGTGTGGIVNITGGNTGGGTGGSVNINASSANATNINTGTSASNVTIGGTANKILLPKFSTVGGLYYTSVNTGQLSTTGANMTWDSINNRLGIGVTNPGYKLSVLSAANPLYLSGVQATSTFSADSILTINAGVVKKTPYASLADAGSWSLTGNGGTTAGTNFIGTTDGVDFVTKTNNAERMRVTSAGLVGIGTNNPASDLTIYQSSGSGNSKGFTFTGNSIGGTSSGTGFLMSLGYNTTGNKQLWIGDADYAGNGSGSFARFAVGGTSFPILDAVSGNNAIRRYLALGVAGDVNSGVIFGGDNTNVSPGSQVWDNGNMTIGNGYKSFAAPTNGLLVQGNVGIGTASPSNALSVSSTNPLYLAGVQATSTFSTDSILTINAGVVKKTPYSSLPTGSSSGWALTGNSISSGQFLGTTNTQALIFKSYNNQVANLDGNTSVGNIAFGLSAVNSTSDHNIAIGYGASTNNQYVTSIGSFANATGANSIAIGGGPSGNSTRVTGAQSIAMGYNANVTTDQTIGIGYQAQGTGQFGIAIGYSANASSGQTVAIGYQPTASGQYGIAIGYQPQATTLQSIAIGYQAKAQAQYNTAIGYQALATGGTQATALGSSAQALLQNNTSVGYAALTTGSDRATAIGASAQAQAQNNTAVGYNAKAINSDKITVVGADAQGTFQNNTVMGYGALATSNNQSTAFGAAAQAQAQNATAVGYGAKANANNSTAVGYNAQTTQTNALVLGDATNTNLSVGIGTSTPNTNTKLDVDGKFKIGDVGTVQKNMVSTSAAVNGSVPAQFAAVTLFGISLIQINSGTSYYDATINLPSTLSSTQASVSVSPSFDLPSGVYIASARVISTTQVRVRFMNANTGAQTISGNLYVTVTEF